jgi:signal peptidase I
MPDKDEKPVVLERGMAEQEWRTPGHVSPLPPKPLLKRLPRARLSDWTEETWAKRLRQGAIALAVVAVLLLALQGSFRRFKADGVSMEPAIHGGDHLIVNRLAYGHIDFGLLDWLSLVHVGARWGKPSRSDLIVFRSPVDDQELVKRVVGLPGETVIIADGHTSIDGAILSEPYAVGQTTCADICQWKIPDDAYFVLGDNRASSLDSRGGWLVPLGNVAGKKLLSY